MKNQEGKLPENAVEKEQCEGPAGEKLSEDMLDGVSAGAGDSGAKYINIRPSMKTEIYGNVMELLKNDEQFVDRAEFKHSLFHDAEIDLSAPPEFKSDRPKPTLVGPDFNFGK